MTAGPGTTMSASAAALKTSSVPTSGTRSDPRDVGHEAAIVGQVRVPLLEARLEILEVVAALDEPERLRRIGRDPVLVPGDLPRDCDDHLAAYARERQDRRLRRAEALRHTGDRAPVRTRVEEVCRLDDRELGLREPPQDRLVRDRRLLRPAAAAEEAAPAALAAARVERDGRERRAPLTQPPVLERDLCAEGTDVDVVASARGEAESVLAHQQRAFTDRAGARYGGARHTHAATVANESSYPQPPFLLYVSHICIGDGDGMDAAVGRSASTWATSTGSSAAWRSRGSSGANGTNPFPARLSARTSSPTPAARRSIGGPRRWPRPATGSTGSSNDFRKGGDDAPPQISAKAPAARRALLRDRQRAGAAGRVPARPRAGAC